MEDEMGGVHVSVEENEGEETKIPNSTRLKLWEEDRISSLPDIIIVRILSLLPTRDAVRTGLLSKRWKYLWTSVTNLDFSYSDRYDSFASCEQLDEFFEFINKTLILCSSDKINKFSLSFDVPLEYSPSKLRSTVSLWLRFATLRNVEELGLYLLADCIMPRFLYHCSSLTKIYTSSCVYPLSKSGQVSWGLLKELTITSTEFLDYEYGVLQMILLGSPLLEFLQLECCGGVPKIDTASNTGLKRLVLAYVMGSGGNLEISIPTVTSLEIWGDCDQTQFKLLNGSSLRDVILDFQADEFSALKLELDKEVTLPEYYHQVWQLLESVSHVKKLKVGDWFIRVLSVLVTKALCPPLSENNFTRLTLTTCFEKWDFPGVASLLDSSPYLEKLVLRSAHCYSLQDCSVKYPIAEDYWSSLPGSFCCLKTVQIFGFKRQRCDDFSYDNDGLCEFINFLRRSSNVLEKLVI